MTEDNEKRAANAWLVVEASRKSSEFPYPQFALELAGNRGPMRPSRKAIGWRLANASGGVTRVARVLRVRSDLKTTTFYFDRLRIVNAGSTLCAAGLALPKAGFDDAAAMERLRRGVAEADGRHA